MDLGSIQAAIGGLQAAGNIAKSLVDLRDISMLQSKTVELQSAILAAQSSALTAQSEQFGLIDRIRNLEEEVRRMEAWETKRHRYELKEITAGTFAYALKEGVQPPEPFHRACANCYARSEIYILQERYHPIGRAKSVGCDNCGAEIYTSGVWNAAHTPRVITRRPR